MNTPTHLIRLSRKPIIGLLAALLAIGLIAPAVPTAQAAPARQATAAATIIIDGIVQSINGPTWMIGGVAIQVTPQTVMTGTPTVGSTIHLVATTDAQGHIVALVITLISTPPTPTSPAPSATPTSGPSPTPGPTIPPGTITPTTTPFPYVVIVIDGPIQTIDLTVSVIVVYGFTIQIDHGNPVWGHLHVGDWVHVHGHHNPLIAATIVIIAIDVVVVNPAPVVIIIDESGKKHKKDKGEGDDD